MANKKVVISNQGGVERSYRTGDGDSHRHTTQTVYEKKSSGGAEKKVSGVTYNPSKGDYNGGGK